MIISLNIVAHVAAAGSNTFPRRLGREQFTPWGSFTIGDRELSRLMYFYYYIENGSDSFYTHSIIYRCVRDLLSMSGI